MIFINYQQAISQKSQKKKKRKKFKEKKTDVLISVFQKENRRFNFRCKLK